MCNEKQKHSYLYIHSCVLSSPRLRNKECSSSSSLLNWVGERKMKSSRLADPDPTIDRVFQRGNPPGRAQKERKKERKKECFVCKITSCRVTTPSLTKWVDGVTSPDSLLALFPF